MVELTLAGPLFTAGSEMSDPGIDAPMARDRFGRFMLPFSLVKGKVLDALKDMETDSGFLKKWLGAESNDANYDPIRGRLRFGDFHTDQVGNPDNVIDRIELDSESGTAKTGMLQMIQAPFGFGEEVTFCGSIDFVGDDTESRQVESIVDKALRWVASYGAYRSIGFGRTSAVKTELELTARVNKTKPAESDRMPIGIRLDRPLCIVGKKHSGNHFESLDVIGGAVLKGAVAQLILQLTGAEGRVIGPGLSDQFPKLCEHFASIRFAEARPRRNDASARPVEPPLSIARSPLQEFKDVYFDAALSEGPGLIEGSAPTFMPDWKDHDFEFVRNEFGFPSLQRERRTRTAIEPRTYRAADEQLFSYGLVLPGVKTEDGDLIDIVWESTIGLEEISVTVHGLTMPRGSERVVRLVSL